jgi:3-oxoadipate enol-lactonase
MPSTTASGPRIVWEERGNGEPVLLVMGHAWPRGMWHRVVPALASRYRVIWFDNRGAGESDSPPGPYTIGQMAADAVAVLDDAGVESAHVYGVSLGGVIAEEIALAYPTRVRSLILGCTGAVTPDKAKARRGGSLQKLIAALPVSVRVRLSVPMTYGPIRDRAKVKEDLAILTSGPVDKAGILAQGAAVPAYVPSAAMDTVAVPTLVLHGDADRIVPYGWGQELAALVPGARLITYAGAGHNFLTDATEKANADVLAFLDGVAAPSAPA